MRFPAVPFLLLLCACQSETTVIEGTLLDPEAATHVQVDEAGELAVIESGAFSLEAIPGDIVELRFEREGRDVGTVQLNGFQGSRHLSLEEIWFDDERGFPS